MPLYLDMVSILLCRKIHSTTKRENMQPFFENCSAGSIHYFPLRGGLLRFRQKVRRFFKNSPARKEAPLHRIGQR